MSKPSTDSSFHLFALTSAVAIGLVFGLVLDNFALGIALGIPLYIAFQSVPSKTS